MSLNQKEKATIKVLQNHSVDLGDANGSLKHYCEDLNQLSEHYNSLNVTFQRIERKVDSMESELIKKDDWISSLEDINIKLCSLMEEMESCLCCCANKKKGRELEEGEVEDPANNDVLEYTSDDEYQTPLMGVLRELHLIKDIPNCADPSNDCGCSLEEAIKVSIMKWRPSWRMRFQSLSGSSIVPCRTKWYVVNEQSTVILEFTAPSLLLVAITMG